MKLPPSEKPHSHAHARRARSSSPAIRVHKVVEENGEISQELSLYCPKCAEWLPVESRRAKRRADEALRRYDDFSPPRGGTDDGPPIGALMTRQVICVRPETALAKVATIFEERSIACVVVLGSNNELVGIVTRSDLNRDRDAVVESPFDLDPVPSGFHVDAEISGTVADVLTPFVFTLPSEAGVRRAAALMAYEGVHHLVVASPGGPVEGVLSSGDVMRWLGGEAGFVVGHHAPAPLHVRAAYPSAPTLPALPVVAAGAVAAKSIAEAPGGRSVLVVDDDTDLREEVADILREEGYRVATAANGLEALALLRHYERPSLILLDLTMPLMNGWSFYTELAKDPDLARIPLVLLSGSAEAPELAGKMGAGEVLQKPLTLRSLLGTVERRAN